MRWMTAAMAVCLLASLARAEQEPPRTINTSGEATVYVVPDEIVLTVGVETFNQSLDRAKQDNDDQAGMLIKAIEAMGIERKHIHTDDVQLEIRYKPNDSYRAGIDGYIARRQYAITLKDAKRAEDLVTRALKNGANRLFGLEYRTTELRKHRDSARQMAIKAAKEKAEALAGELECKLGSPRTITEGSIGYWGPVSRWGGNGWMMANNSQNFVQNTGGGADEGGETMPLGQIAVKAQVSVSFDLVPGK